MVKKRDHRVWYGVLFLALFFSFSDFVFGSTLGNINSCQVLNTMGIYTLTTDVDEWTDGACFNMTTDNITLSCKGFKIGYNRSAINVTPGGNDYFRNITVENCVLGTNESAWSHTHGIVLSNISKSRILNNSIRTNGTSSNYGIYLTDSMNNTIKNNSIHTNGNSGLFLFLLKTKRKLYKQSPVFDSSLKQSGGLIMLVKDVQSNQGNIDLVLMVKEKGETRTFEKFGRSGRVCSLVGADESGEIKITLWNDDVDKVNTGDKIHIKNGWCSEFQGEKQVSTGKFGSLEILEHGSAEKSVNQPVEDSAPELPVMGTDEEESYGEEPDDEPIKEEETVE